MAETRYSATAVLFASRSDGMPLASSSAAARVEGILAGHHPLAREVVPKKLYELPLHDQDSRHVLILAGFTSLKRAVCEGRLIAVPSREAMSGKVAAAIVSFSYTAPWIVNDIGAKTWDAFHAAFTSTGARYHEFLAIENVDGVDTAFGYEGALTWQPARTHEWEGFIHQLRNSVPDQDALPFDNGSFPQ